MHSFAPVSKLNFLLKNRWMFDNLNFAKFSKIQFDKILLDFGKMLPDFAGIYHFAGNQNPDANKF